MVGSDSAADNHASERHSFSGESENHAYGCTTTSFKVPIWQTLDTQIHAFMYSAQFKLCKMPNLLRMSRMHRSFAKTYAMGRNTRAIPMSPYDTSHQTTKFLPKRRSIRPPDNLLSIIIDGMVHNATNDPKILAKYEGKWRTLHENPFVSSIGTRVGVVLSRARMHTTSAIATR